MGEPNWDFLLSEQVRQNSRLFFRLAHSILGDDAAAQDVCQEAFKRAWEQRDKIDPSGVTLKSWISRTVTTESLQRVRRAKIEQRVLGNHASVQPEVDEGATEREQLYDAIMAAVAHLPKQARSIIKMRYLDGIPANEVMKEFGCSATDLWRQVQRGFEQLRGLLSDWRDDPEI